MSRTRIAIGSIFTECNHLGGLPTDLSRFERNELRRGKEVLESTTGTIGGMLGTLREQQAEIAPLIVASTCPGGPLTSACYLQLKSEMLDRLQQALPVEGVLLALHGSASAEDAGDLEGDLLQAVRDLVGPRVPVIASLDLHAHVTEQMVHQADALVAWETYPHKDAFATGVRAARLLLDMLAGKCRPTMALAKVPVIVSGVRGSTEGDGPFADVMRFAKSHEGQNGVLSTSVFLVHPYLDLPDMGGGGLVITDNDMPRAAVLAEQIARQYWDRRFDLEPPVFTPAEAIRRGLEIDGGPVLLVETADCCGGGASGDSVATLRVLLETCPDVATLVPVVDPAAAALCHRMGEGHFVDLLIGHKLEPRWGDSLPIKACRIIRLSDGRFRYTGGVWEGQDGQMGPSAVVERGGAKILITSHATYDWADEQFHSVGLDARAAKFIVVKNPMNYHLGYAGLFKAAFILDTPGPTPAVLRHVAFRNLMRPFFPADQEITGLTPRIVRHLERG